MQKSRRYENLDALRTLCCLGIIAMHIRANANYQISGCVYNKIIPSWTHFVILFIMLSGFSMCCGYYDKVLNGKISIEEFYAKRIKKNLPFFACLVALAVVMEHSLEGIYEGIAEVSMAFGLLPNNELSILGVSWTLGVIFLFYMLFPYFVFLISNKKRAWFSFAVSLIINQLCSGYFFTEKFVVPSFSARHSFLFCTPYFFAGGLIYLYREHAETFVKNHKVLSTVLTIVAINVYPFIPMSNERQNLLPIVSIVCYSILLIFFIGIETPVFNNKLFHYLGGISMELYLAQMVAFRAVEKLGGLYAFGEKWIAFVMTNMIVVILLIVGIELYKYSIHIMKKEKLYKLN